MSATLTDVLAGVRTDVDAELDRLLPPPTASPGRLHEAMRYSVFAGGKRLRPALTVVAGETLGAPRRRLLPGAAALEMLHTYSLIHDDLPALDNDDLRRGRPTLHRAFDEAAAILAGDALLTLGLVTLARLPEDVGEAVRRQATVLVGDAVGTAGMIGGQVDDLAAEAAWPADPAAALDAIHRRKTGALLTASVRLGGLYAGADAATDAVLKRLGEALGLMFQIADDILDVEGTAAEMGKGVQKDAAARKLTYPGLHGIEASKLELARLAAVAHAAAAELPGGGGAFPALVDHFVTRRS